MKKQEIVTKLQEIAELNKKDIADSLLSFLEELTTTPDAKEKITRGIEILDMVQEPNVKYPAQMITCFEIIKETGFAYLKLEEVRALFVGTEERLKTKQDPFRIYNFYQQRMAEAGWIIRTKS